MDNSIETTGKRIVTQESLQPQRIGKEEKAYQSVKDIAERLSKGDATNIALTGPYGSGKSSILITLKEDYPEYKFLNISLATLKPDESKVENDEEEDKEDSVTKLNLDRLIEYSILQQLIYKERQEVLPNSRFKRIFHLPQQTVKNMTFAILGALAALVIVFEPVWLRVEWLCELFGIEWLNILADTLSIGYLCWFAYEAVKRIVPAVSNSRLNKLNLKDGEIEIVKNTSIFNKHLDEILYFFDQTEYNVVMLEDLDRFETTDIFLKLRELNLLLNESKVIDRNIFFVYAVRDDMFKDSERVKCFDYITTVIPVINRSNAKNQLKEELQKRGVTEIADAHLQDLGFFLHDMRLLKNIANEYVQYRGKLEKGISCEKLLGMIVYKNYHPKDFADLHDCKGIVYELLRLKEDLVADRIAQIEEENKRKREQQERYVKERHLKEVELRRIYLDAYRDRMNPTMQHIKIENNSHSLKDIAANEKLFDKLKSNATVHYTYIDTNGGYYGGNTRQGNANVPFAEIESVVNPSMTYAERLSALRATFEELEQAEIVEIKKEDVRSQTLSQLMASVDYEDNKKYAALNVPDLIEYLVVRGYIDENYYDYISYFYDNFIDAQDWNFVLDLKLNKTHAYDYHINNVEASLEEIPKAVYRKKAILNIDLLDYLAEHSADRMNLVRMLVMLRTTVEGQKYDFFAAYYQKGKQQDVVFEKLFSEYKNLWAELVKRDDDKHSLKLCWFKYAEAEQSCGESQEWISKNFSFITDHLQDVDEKQWTTLIVEGKYPFAELNDKSRDVLRAVADAGAYQLTRKNVEILVSSMLNRSLESVSYRLVNETEHKGLIERVEENLGVCMKSVFTSPESEKENENAILGILLSVKAAENEKINYLNKQQIKVDLEQIEGNGEKTLGVKSDVVNVTWKNVVHYLNNVSEQATDEAIIGLVERHASELEREPLDGLEEDDKQLLLKLFVSSNTLKYEAYVMIVNRFSNWRYSGGVPGIEERRLRLMNDKGMFSYTEKNTQSLLDGYSGAMMAAYLMRNKREFLAAPSEVAYNHDIALELMKSCLTAKEKSQLIPYFDKGILSAQLSNEIISVLNLHEIELNVEFMLAVMKVAKMSREKLNVLNYILEKNDFDDATITAFIESLPEPYKNVAEKGKKPELPDTDEVRRLVGLLQEKGYISSYSESKKGIRVNTKMK